VTGMLLVAFLVVLTLGAGRALVIVADWLEGVQQRRRAARQWRRATASRRFWSEASGRRGEGPWE